MNKQLDLLLTLRDNINVVAQTLLKKKDVTGETLPTLSGYEFNLCETVEGITREIMYTVDPSTDPANEV